MTRVDRYPKFPPIPVPECEYCEDAPAFPIFVKGGSMKLACGGCRKDLEADGKTRDARKGEFDAVVKSIEAAKRRKGVA